jgi:hypothetical protein
MRQRAPAIKSIPETAAVDAKACHTTYDARDVIDPATPDYRIYVS